MLVISDNPVDVLSLKGLGITIQHRSKINNKIMESYKDSKVLYINYGNEDDMFKRYSELMMYGVYIRTIRPSDHYSLKGGINSAVEVISNIEDYLWNNSSELLESMLDRLPSFWHAAERYLPEIKNYLISLYENNKMALRAIIHKFNIKYRAELETLIGSHVEGNSGYWGIKRNRMFPVTNFKINKLARKDYSDSGINYSEFIIYTDKFGVIHLNGEGVKSSNFIFKNFGVKVSSTRDLSDLIGRVEFDEYRIIHPGIHDNEVFLPGSFNDYIVPEVMGLDINADTIGGKTINTLLKNKDYIELAEKALDTMFGNNLHVFYTDQKGSSLPVFKKGMEILGYENLPTVDFRTVKAMKDVRVSNFFPHFVIAKEFTDEMALYSERSLTNPESVPYPVIFVVKSKPKQDIDSIEIPRNSIPLVNLNSGLAWNIYQEINSKLPEKDPSIITKTVDEWKHKNIVRGGESLLVN